MTTGEDNRLIREAEGWLELGDHVAAFETLECLPPLQRAHPDVLKLRWRIYNKAGKHESAFAIADGMARVFREDAEVFVWRSYSARRMPGGGAERALSLLLEVANDFPNETAVPFDLARYNCLLGRLVAARNWLQIAFETAERKGTARAWKLKALDDTDLEPLRTESGL